MASDSSLSITQRLLRYVKPYRKDFVLALVFMVVFGATDGAVPFLVKYILDGVFTTQNTSLLWVLPVLLFVFALIRGGVDFAQQFLMARIGLNLTRDLRNDVHRHILKLSSDFFVHRSSADLVSRVTSDVLLVRTLLTDAAAAVIRDSIRIVALLAAAIYLDWLLALIAAVVFPLGIYPVYRFGKRMRRLSRVGQEATGKISSLLQETALGHRVVKIFGREDHEHQRFLNENQNLTGTFIKAERVKALTGPVNEVLATLVICGVILYGGYSVINNFRTQGAFIAFLLAVFLLYDPFKKLSRISSTVQQGLAGAERLFEVLDTEPTVRDPAQPRELPAGTQIEFRNVSFTYAPRGGAEAAGDGPALTDINLTITPGMKIALVGFSGAGKSTLVDLIPRFIDPVEGAVLLDGVDIRQLRIADLRSKIAMVTQHTFLFHDTVYNNIAYGAADATEEQVEQAARSAFAFDFISKLPAKFQTVLGESGLTLSGGERQRLAIARALLKDAPILILDEATASLDSHAEREVQGALERLEQGRTTIVIAHRLSTVMNADLIVVLRAGRIVEQGTYQELLDRGGEFARLYSLQFSETAPPVLLS